MTFIWKQSWKNQNVEYDNRMPYCGPITLIERTFLFDFVKFHVDLSAYDCHWVSSWKINILNLKYDY